MKGLLGILAILLLLLLVFWSWNELAPGSGVLPDAAVEEITGAVPLGQSEDEEEFEDRHSIAAPPAEAPIPAVRYGSLRVELRRGGQPLTGSSILLRNLAMARGLRRLPFREGFSDEQGDLVFADLSPGPYDVTPLVLAERYPVTIKAGEETVLRCEVPLGVAVSVLVQDAAAVPIPGASVILSWGWTSEWMRLGVCDAQGRLELASVTPDSRLAAMAPGYAPSHAQSIRAAAGSRYQLTIDLRRPGASIHGQILGPTGSPAAPAFVAILAAQRQEDYRDERGQVWRAPAPQVMACDHQGRFRCESVPAGRVILIAGSRLHAELLPARLDLELAAAEERFVELSLDRGASIFGEISDAAGRPASAVSVFARSESRSGGPGDPEYDLTQFYSQDAESDAAGRYRIPALLPGSYRLISAGGRPFAAEPPVLELGPGQSLRQDLQIAGKSKLILELRGPGGEVLAGWQASARRKPGGWSEALSDAKGMVEFANVYAGLFLIQLQAPGTGELQHSLTSASFDDLRTGDEVHHLRVGAAELPSARIRAQLLGPDGLPAEGTRLILSRVVARFPEEIAVEADEDGRFDLGPLPSGPCKLQFQARGYASLRHEIELVPGEVLDLGLLSFAR